MQALFPEIRRFLKSFSPVTVRILRWGMPLVLGMLLSGFVCRLLAGTVGEFDKMLRMSEELLLCGKEMLGAVGVGALVLQLFLTAYAYDHPQNGE